LKNQDKWEKGTGPIDLIKNLEHSMVPPAASVFSVYHIYLPEQNNLGN
jgi:hypothetical protein